MFRKDRHGEFEGVKSVFSHLCPDGLEGWSSLEVSNQMPRDSISIHERSVIQREISELRQPCQEIVYPLHSADCVTDSTPCATDL